MTSVQIGSQWHGGNPPFMQQGQVDWVAFGNTIWTASSAVLQRFAAAGIQPVTYGAGVVLFSPMRLDRVGQSRMEKAIRSLSSISAFGKALWFGFGYQNFVHTMAETVAGIKCLAICACLAEAHTEALAAWVLAELWRVSGFHEDYEPSHSQFLALVKASAGVISRTEFSRIMDKMLGDQLWRQPLRGSFSDLEAADVDEGILEASNAKDLAYVLHGLFKVSRGAAAYMEVNGGSECAFVAALANWLLNLKVQVQNSNGQITFDNTKAGEAVQVCVRYGHARGDAIQLAGTTYLLRSCREIISRIPDKEDFPLIARTPWETCLVRVFGGSFIALSKLPHLLGDYLGSVARVYTALATGEPNVAGLSRQGFVGFAEASHGYGFIETILSTFQELKDLDGLSDRMIYAAGLTFDDAIRNIESSVLGLESLCSCDECSLHKNSLLNLETSRTCIVGVAYAVRRIAMIMSSVIQDSGSPTILPTIAGLFELSAFRKEPQMSRPPVFGTEPTHKHSKWTRASFYWNTLGLHHEQPTDTSFDYHILAGPALLFQGSRERTEGMSFTDPQTCTALSRRGICCFVAGLTALSCQAEIVCKVHVLPGVIQYRAHPYDSVHDGLTRDSREERLDGTPAEDGSDLTYAAASLQRPSLLVPTANTPHTTMDVQPLVTELTTGSSLSYVYRITLPTVPIYISPGKLTQIALRDSGLIACASSSSCKSQLAFPCSVVERGWKVREDHPNLSYTSGIACCVWTCDDEVSRCVALALHSRTHKATKRIIGGHNFVFLRRHECLPCSSQSVLRDSGMMVAKIGNKHLESPKITVHII